MSDKTEERPKLGTAEAAVQSCVRLIASVAGQPEALVAYWLDLYYQVRCVYERENAPEPDPTVLRRGDLYPVLRELMQDALKSAVGDGRGKDPSTPLAEPGTSRASRASGCSDQDDRKAEKAGDGPPRASRAGIASHANPRVALAPTGEAENGDADAEPASPGELTLSGFSPVKIEPDRGGWKLKKAAIRERLIKARDAGVTAASW